MACARPECPRNDYDLPPRRDPRRRLDGYSRLMGEHEAVTARAFANIAWRSIQYADHEGSHGEQIELDIAPCLGRVDAIEPIYRDGRRR